MVRLSVFLVGIIQRTSFCVTCFLIQTFVFRLGAAGEILVSGDLIRVSVAYSLYLPDICAVALMCSACLGFRGHTFGIRTSHA